jgi:hypothetical protein
MMIPPKRIPPARRVSISDGGIDIHLGRVGV